MRSRITRDACTIFWDVMPYKGKVKCNLVQALRLCTGRTAHKGSRGIALLFLYHGTRRRWGVSVTLWPLFNPRKDPAPIVQEAGWGPRPVWTGVENLAPTGIRSPDHPARSQLLYRLRYSAHMIPYSLLEIDIWKEPAAFSSRWTTPHHITSHFEKFCKSYLACPCSYTEHPAAAVSPYFLIIFSV